VLTDPLDDGPEAATAGSGERLKQLLAVRFPRDILYSNESMSMMRVAKKSGSVLAARSARRRPFRNR
jgi:hypothetical protein